MTTPGTALSDSAATADAALARLDDVLARISDGDLHLATPGGGWTVAQVIAHITVSTLVWLGDMERLRQDPELTFFFREEIGHDALGYPPPTVAIARGRIASTRRTTVEIPDLGTKTAADWIPIIVGHLTGHVDQALDVLRSRDALPQEA
jgi:hypothetical protein